MKTTLKFLGVQLLGQMFRTLGEALVRLSSEVAKSDSPSEIAKSDSSED